jgi:cathepsin L
MKLLVLAVFLGVAAAAVVYEFGNATDEAWAAYKVKYDKNYSDNVEDEQRRAIWEGHLQMVEQHNARHSKGEVSYRLGMNKFADMTNAEFVETHNGLKQSPPATSANRKKFVPPLGHVNDAGVDWRTKGYVTGVKDQGQCGSCWAFSATGALEGQWFHKTRKLISMSEQNLVDCSQPQGNEGCDGGLMDQAFTYIQQQGIESEMDYPYKAVDQTCMYDPAKKIASDTGFVDITSGDEYDLTTAIGTVGPISVGIDASQSSFQLYESGVYDEPNCSDYQLDHGVLAVGYNTDPTGGSYYIVKNSWGDKWGMQGYIWMSRDKQNQCGIATAASFPIVD